MLLAFVKPFARFFHSLIFFGTTRCNTLRWCRNSGNCIELASIEDPQRTCVTANVALSILNTYGNDQNPVFKFHQNLHPLASFDAGDIIPA